MNLYYLEILQRRTVLKGLQTASFANIVFPAADHLGLLSPPHSIKSSKEKLWVQTAPLIIFNRSNIALASFDFSEAFTSYFRASAIYWRGKSRQPIGERISYTWASSVSCYRPLLQRQTTIQFGRLGGLPMHGCRL
jgi:hypothetical protein